MKPAEPTSSQPDMTTAPGTSNLPELVVDGEKKKSKKTAKSKDKATVTSTSDAASQPSEPPPPGVS
ncbi:hypothetical protein OFC57_40730, partial [Escherichia coli]|nr:hypothetical protein [Escherichia coli]